MCNRYRITASRAAIAARFGITVYPDADTLPQPELFPKRTGWIVRQHEGQRVLDTAQWGVPTTIKDKRTGKTLVKEVTNVRNLTSPNWRNMLNNPERRCLVPVTDF